MNAFAKLLVSLVSLDMRPREALRFYLFLGVSVGAHLLAAFLLWFLPLIGLFDEPEEPIAVEFVDLAPEPEPAVEPEPEAEAEAEAEPEPEPEPVVRRPPTPEEPPEVEPEPEPEPAPIEEAIADFTGDTLTNDTGASWASATGNGAPMEGPIGQPGAQVTGRVRHGGRRGAPDGAGEAEVDRPVPMRNLSRRPAPPNARLAELLQTNYPRAASRLGLIGVARVRVRVEPDGRVRVLAILSEDEEGFGSACRRTLREGGRWQPPLDAHGNPVATITNFSCTFRPR